MTWNTNSSPNCCNETDNGIGDYPSDIELMQEYPRVLRVYLHSTTDNNSVFNPDHISNVEHGYYLEMEKVGQALPYIVSDTSPGANGFTDRLRPTKNLTELINQDALLWHVDFAVYETIVPNSTLSAVGSPVQHVATKNALLDPANLYPQTARGCIIPQHKPNGFNPSVRINGKEIYPGLRQSSLGNRNNKGDIANGISFPFCEPFRKRFNIQQIEARAACARYVSETGLWWHYFVECLLEFRVK